MNQKNITVAVSFFTLVIPVIAFAQVGIPCNGVDCDFNSLMMLANNIISFLMFSVAVPLAAIGFTFMGGKMILYSNKVSAVSEAKEGMESIAIGFAIMLGAFVLIKVVLSAFLSTEDGFLLFLIS